MRKTCIYFIISSILIFCNVNITSAQGKKVVKKEDKKEEKLPPVKWWNGFMVQMDMASVVTSAISFKETYSLEGAVQFDLKHKLYPVIELGYAGADKLSKENIRFQTNGAFGRIGLDFNLRKQKKDAPLTSNLFLAGIRLGMTKSAYELNNVKITDGYWGGSETLTPYTLSPSQLWYELVLGVKVEISKNIFMGWTVRTKSLLGANKDGEMTPWYIPGFGINSDSNWGFNYTLGYKFK